MAATDRRRRAVLRRATGIAMVALLAACSGPSGTEVVASDAPAADGDRQGGSQRDHGSGSGSESGSERGAADDDTVVCDDATIAAVDDTLRGQLAAFADDDYAEALTYASSDFQRDFDVDSFRTLITTDFAAIVDTSEHLLLRCDQVASDVARVDVVVTSSDGGTSPLTYLFVEEDGRWAVAAAANLPDTSMRT